MEDNEYRDGGLNYTIIEALIEEIVDKYELRGYIYMESENYDNVMTSTMVQDNDADGYGDDVQYNALLNLVSDILENRDEIDRNAAIADIYDVVYKAIHGDETEDDDDLEEEC